MTGVVRRLAGPQPAAGADEADFHVSELTLGCCLRA
jgi:hypothetical protein